MKNLENTRWLITGGTSGLGLALTENLTSQGARVAVVARTEARLNELAKRLPIIPILADVADKASINRIAAQAFASLGGLDFLVNNASSLGGKRLRPLLDTDCEDFEAALDVNVLAPMRLTKIVLGAMLLQGSGLVINISTDASINAYPNWGAYGASKAALDHLTKIWNAEVEGSGVRFLAIDPGDMDTPMHEAALPGSDRSGLKQPGVAAGQILDLVRNGDFEEIRNSL